MKPIPDLVLASASPRRQHLLQSLGVEFTVVVADVDESMQAGELPLEYVGRVASQKSDFVAKQRPDSAILAADTIVTLGGSVFGKPDNQEHALDMWHELSGRVHQVVTAVSLAYKENARVDAVTTDVEFCKLSRAEMQQYWDSGEPQDKAGAYGIQGLASAWVNSIHGSYSNVVGLPLFETNRLLKTVGHNWL